MLRAGTGTQIITPPVGTSLSGYFHDRISTGVHDDLLAKALVLDDGKTQLAIAICDVLRVQRLEVLKAREIASKATGIPADSIFIATTHTHTGPELNIERPLVPVNEKYLAEIPRMIADAIIQAHSNLKPAALRLGEEYEDRIAFNRRFRMRDGSVRFNPGKLNPDIIAPDGPIDPQINVLRVDDEAGAPICILVNYSLHPDVMTGNEISADWPGEMSRMVSSLYESAPLVIFMQGTCGNINHLDVATDRYQSGWAEVTRISRVMAGKVLAASELSKPMESQALGSASSVMDIKYHPMTDTLRAHAAEVLKANKPDEKELAQAQWIQKYDLDGKTADVEVQAMRIGDAGLVGVPGEYFVEYGLSIKEWSPFDQTFVGELANGSFGYIPTSDAFYPGTYETMPILSAQLEPSVGVRIADEAGQLLRRLDAD
ncbi:MAG: neutral/alkaline non-lysosomal ceramidase N-terminal domain-containing protein [Armatimonadetes bacterium]|nr:neutral/alkaline non-lysosomal ceramidase N-terminal domain-containing protein [Armatimonadota bacterium]